MEVNYMKTFDRRSIPYENYPTHVIERIKSRTMQTDDGCVEYIGNHTHKYGLISITINGNRKSVPAHRAMWMAHNKCFDLPRCVIIRHKCDNPRCVNITHLDPGSAKDNMADCISRGRRARRYRLHTRHRVIDDSVIKAIRAATGRVKDIAIAFGVSNGYVSKIRLMKAKTLL